MQMQNINGVDCMSVQEVADTLGVSAGRVRQIIVAGELERYKLGNTNWIPVPSVDAYKAKKKVDEQ